VQAQVSPVGVFGVLGAVYLQFAGRDEDAVGEVGEVSRQGLSRVDGVLEECQGVSLEAGPCGRVDRRPARPKGQEAAGLLR
jgi:hypothetical protein